MLVHFGFDLCVFAIYLLFCVYFISIIALHHVQFFVINLFSSIYPQTVLFYERAVCSPEKWHLTINIINYVFC